jgi:AcrR family transcriptional regulator
MEDLMPLPPAARGRHAPPPEVRLPLQRQRLLRAAAAEFAARGYAGSSSESISRRAGMSKATFYEHFANKEECMLALFDLARQVVGEAMADAARRAPIGNARERMRAATRAFLSALSEHPEFAQTLLVEIIGAGPRATERRDAILDAFADAIYRDNERTAPKYRAPRFASRDDAFACIGAIVELASRQLRTKKPADIRELEPVIDRLMLGVLEQSRTA